MFRKIKHLLFEIARKDETQSFGWVSFYAVFTFIMIICIVVKRYS